MLYVVTLSKRYLKLGFCCYIVVILYFIYGLFKAADSQVLCLMTLEKEIVLHSPTKNRPQTHSVQKVAIEIQGL